MKINLKSIFEVIFITFGVQIAIVFANSLLKIHVTKFGDIAVLNSLESDQVHLLDFPRVNKDVLVFIGDSKSLNKISQILKDKNIQFSLMERPHRRTKRSESGKDKFLTFKEYEDWIQSLKSLNNTLIKIDEIGISFENRSIYSIQIGINEHNPIALFESGCHAREWLSIASIIGTINKIVRNLQEPNNNVLKNILTKWTLYFVPVLNPDGYTYTTLNESSRYWRKNRQNIPGQECTGIDINRNFPIGFQENTSTCSNDYSGTHPFASPEARSLASLVTKIQNRLKLYISFHCFGQYILLPWAYTDKKIENYDKLKHIAQSLNETMFNVGRRVYLIGTPGNILYTAGGTSFDWIKSLGIPYSYTIELSPDSKSQLGFIVPETFIEESVKEVYEVLLTALLKVI